MLASVRTNACAVVAAQTATACAASWYGALHRSAGPPAAHARVRQRCDDLV